MGEELLAIANAAQEQVESERRHQEKVRKLHKKKQQLNVEYALNRFKDALAQLKGIRSFGIEKSKLKSAPQCLVIIDAAGRRFEIHYEKVMFNGKHFNSGSSDYNIHAQWRNETWLTYSVGMSEKEVARQLGRWLAQTESAKLA